MKFLEIKVAITNEGFPEKKEPSNFLANFIESALVINGSEIN